MNGVDLLFGIVKFWSMTSAVFLEYWSSGLMNTVVLIFGIVELCPHEYCSSVFWISGAMVL